MTRKLSSVQAFNEAVRQEMAANDDVFCAGEDIGAFGGVFQSYAGLQRYLKQGLLQPRELDQLNRLLKLWEAMGDQERRLGELQQERERVYKAQEQVRGNMGALGQTGKEGTLRGRYVEQLEATEGQLRAVERQEAEAHAEIARLQREIDAQLARMG